MKTRMKTRHEPQPGIAAKYATRCVRCDEPIERGYRIVFQRGNPIHVHCASGADDE